MLILGLQTLGLAVIIVAAGFFLTSLGDRIGEETGFGESLVGFIMLAAITSLPELSTSLSAARIGQADLVAGNIMGSNLFNLSIIAVMVLFLRRKKTEDGDVRNVLTGTFSIILASLAGLAILTGFPRSGELLLVAYLVLMFLNYRFERRQLSGEQAPSLQLRRLWLLYVSFLALGAIVVAAGYAMTVVCDRIAVTPFDIGGNVFVLGRTFVGQLFLAIATSLPEMIVTLSAVRIGKINMAYANIFGSNLFNLAILGLSGVCYSGNMFRSIGQENLVSLLVFVGMASISIAALKYRPVKRFRFDGLVMLLMFLFNLIYVFNR